MKKPAYPLEQIALIKQKRLEEAEKVLKEKKEILDKEEAALELAKKKREEVRKHKDKKIQQLWDELEEGTTSDKIEIHEKYIQDVVAKQLEEENKKVKKQQEVVKTAREEVDKAREDRMKKEQEKEKIALHRKEWEKEMKLEAIRDEANLSDELGTSMHARKKRRQG